MEAPRSWRSARRAVGRCIDGIGDLTLALLPIGQNQFFATGGAPLVAGIVYMYVPGSTVIANTWADPLGQILNPNPIILDAAGRSPPMWGNGQYRQLVLDSNGIEQWDLIVSIGDMAQESSANVNITGGTIANCNLNSPTFSGNLSGLPQAFPSGTQLVFVQAFAPTGWTLNAGYNDLTLRLFPGPGGGSIGGSWTINGLIGSTSVLGHALTAGELPAHTHNVNNIVTTNTPNINISGSGGANAFAGTVVTDGGNVGNAAHTHAATTTVTNDGTWRPAYVGAVVCVKS